jgi:hypothetical protein
MNERSITVRFGGWERLPCWAITINGNGDEGAAAGDIGWVDDDTASCSVDALVCRTVDSLSGVMVVGADVHMKCVVPGAHTKIWVQLACPFSPPPTPTHTQGS